ncbi:MAG TPA: hypothetical protein VN929_10610 [Burkholderiales bacterium]|nr:hypothetical protein [Burkholderiales bacterium]
MSIRQVQIIDALKNLVLNQRGLDFQRLATSLAKKRFPDLVASDPAGDLGSDAYLLGFLTVDGKKIAVAASLTAEYKKIRSDCDTILKKQGHIDQLLFYTPIPRKRTLTKLWGDKLKAEFGVGLDVVTQNEIVEVLREPENSWICNEYLDLHFSEGASLAELRSNLVLAATNSLAGWIREHGRHLRIEALVEPNLEELGEEAQSNERLSVADLQHLVDTRRDCLVLGGPGAGKTTLLIQLAQALLTAADGPIPILVSAANWANSGKTLTEFVVSQTAFQAVGLTVEKMAQLSQAGHISYLINGWNEISQARIGWVTDQFREEQRAYPPPSFVVVTRQNGNRPTLIEETVVQVLGFTDQSRAELLRKRVGQEAAVKLVDKLEGDHFLDELTKTPLFLSATLAYYERHGDFPETTFAALGGLVETAEQYEPHKSALNQPPIRGHHRRYLTEMASKATDTGEVLLSRASARAHLLDTARRLAAESQLASLPEPEEVATALTDHHLLVEISSTDRPLRFSHQQIQEWFAALYLWNQFFQTDDPWNDTERAALNAIVNKRDWEQALLLLVEHLASKSGSKPKLLELALLTLPLDLIFACELLNRADIADEPAAEPNTADRNAMLWVHRLGN